MIGSQLHRLWRKSLALKVLVAATLGLFSGCGDDAGLPVDGETTVRYPMALTPLPDGNHILVWGANFDRKYRAGKVRLLDTASEKLVGTGLEVAGFVGGAALQLPYDASTTQTLPQLRALMTSRETDDLTQVDVKIGASPQLACGDHDLYGHCSQHFPPLDNTNDKLSIGADPMGIEVRPWIDGKWLVMTVAAADGRVAALTVDAKGQFAPLGSLNLGAGLVALKTVASSGRTYISDARAPSVYAVVVEKNPENLKEYRVRAAKSIALPAASLRDFAHGLAQSLDGGRLYVANRSPAALITIDIAQDVGGEPRDQVVDVLPLGGQPSEVAVAPSGPAGHERVYVSCFNDDAIWVIDPQLRAVVQRIALPHAPFGLVAVNVPSAHPTGSGQARGWMLYTGLFNKHAVAALPIAHGAIDLHAVRLIGGTP